MAIVKADAYGHGLIPCARAALQAGATWLGVALSQEAIELRDAGVGGQILTWLTVPGSPIAECLVRDVEVTVSARWALEEVRAASAATGVVARVQLKADTGLSRNGCSPADWPDLVAAAREAERDGLVQVTGVWTHLACADLPGHPSVPRALELFALAVVAAEAAGLRPHVLHVVNSAGLFDLPQAHHTLVRPGIALYGLTPSLDVGTAHDLGLRPVMSLRARLASVKHVPGGSGVSYGHEYVTASDTTLALVPLGYADGIPRAASHAGPVLVAGAVRSIAGRVCMDQIVLDIGDDVAAPGDEAVLFGADGPSADEWAIASGTIGYEIVTRIGARVPRVYVGEQS
jgi:alanine racemase